ncbi:MAG: hypothetical protein WC369_01675 [Dehalococcoidales bacterium]|jgi:hypothetical protein
MKKRAVIAIISCCAVIALIFPFAMLANTHTAYFAYKEITYKTMADSIAGGPGGPVEEASRINSYFHRYLFTPFGAQAVDKDTYNDIIRGIAYCDQKAWGMSSFLAKRGMDSRMVMTVNPDGQSNHTALEADINGGWKYFDPQYSLVIRGKDGEITSYREICEDPSLLPGSARMGMLKKACPEEFAPVAGYLGKNVFNPGIIKPVVWNSPAKCKGTAKRLLSAALDAYTSLFGKRFSNIYQDAYMRIYSGKSTYNKDYFLARNYDIYGRTEKAIYHYRKFIGGSPDDADRHAATLFLSIIYTNTGDYKAAIEALRMMADGPGSSKWGPTVNYWLGYNYELQDDRERAEGRYRESIKGCAKTGDVSDAVKILELDSFERLAGLI